MPHVVEDLALRQHPARVQHHEPQQLELGARQLYGLVAATHLTRLLVEREVGEAHGAVAVRISARASQHRLHPGNDLGEAERLRDVVVGEREPRNLVLRRVLRGEEDHGNAVVAVAKAPRDREPVEVGQHHVEHDQVGAEVVDRLLGRAAGAYLHRLEALVPERGRNRVRDRRLIVDDEHLRDARGECCDLCHGLKSANDSCALPVGFL